MKKIIGRILLTVACLAGALVLCVVLLFLWLTIVEYRPKASESLETSGESSRQLALGRSLSVLTWNVGYGALGDNADFFLDGGKNVYTAGKARVLENMDDIMVKVKALDPDVAFFQEVDVKADRSHKINEKTMLSDALPGRSSAFAWNFKVPFIPYPLPPIGQVNAGILSLSRFPVSSSLRVQLPCPFTYPMRICNLKRCLLVERLPIEGSDKELVMVNLHLEAYDSGEGKIAQTKMLREVLESEYKKGNYVIAGGDFNQQFSNANASGYPVYKGMWKPGILNVDEFSGQWQFCMSSKVPSCRSLDKAYEGADKQSFQYYLIDGFIVSPNIRVDSLDVCDFAFRSSDHNPVMLRVTLL